MPEDHELLYSLTYRDAVELLRTVRDSEFCEAMTLEIGDMKLSVTRRRESGAGRPARAEAASSGNTAAVVDAPSGATPSVASVANARETGVQHVDQELRAVVAPTLGTYYRAPAPGEPPCVKEGDVIEPDDAIGLIEVMKLFTPIAAGVAGRVVKILVEDSTLVEYGQRLVLIDPT